MLNQLLRPAFIIFCFTIPAWLLLRFIIWNDKKKRHVPFSLQRELLLFITYLYITCTLIITIVPVPMTRSENGKHDRINLIPVVNTIKDFIELSPQRRSMSGHILENTFGNILLFIPLGILLPLLSKRMSLRRLLITAFLFSLMIETTQFISSYFGVYRYADIDDIILNTSGACIGFVMIRKVKK